jgi:hypothetical protein
MSDRTGLLQLDPPAKLSFRAGGCPPSSRGVRPLAASPPTCARSSTPASRPRSLAGSRPFGFGRTSPRPVLFRLRGFAPPWRFAPSVRCRFVAPCCRWRFVAFLAKGSAGYYSPDRAPRSSRRVSYPPKNSPRLQPYRVTTALAFLPFSPDPRHRARERALGASGASRARCPSRRTEPDSARLRAPGTSRLPTSQRASRHLHVPAPKRGVDAHPANPVSGIPDVTTRRCSPVSRLPDRWGVLCVATRTVRMRRIAAPSWSGGENRRCVRPFRARARPTVACRLVGRRSRQANLWSGTRGANTPSATSEPLVQRCSWSCGKPLNLHISVTTPGLCCDPPDEPGDE